MSAMKILRACTASAGTTLCAFLLIQQRHACVHEHDCACREKVLVKEFFNFDKTLGKRQEGAVCLTSHGSGKGKMLLTFSSSVCETD